MEDKSELLNTIFLGEVANVHNYGAFVRIPGRPDQGMVHRSQLSSVGVDDATDVLQKGDKVWCKVISVTDDGKLSLSMKVVQQGTGKDLDPTGVQAHQDEMKRKSRPDRNQKKAIQLGAVLNTTCSKCGTRGHLAKDCFKSPDGKIYELIPSEDEEHPSDDGNKISSATTEASLEKEITRKKEKKKNKKSSKEKKKEKKAKKKKKKRKRSHSDSSSQSSDEEQSAKKRRHCSY